MPRRLSPAPEAELFLEKTGLCVHHRAESLREGAERADPRAALPAALPLREGGGVPTGLSVTCTRPRSLYPSNQSLNSFNLSDNSALSWARAVEALLAEERTEWYDDALEDIDGALMGCGTGMDVGPIEYMGNGGAQRAVDRLVRLRAVACRGALKARLRRAVDQPLRLRPAFFIRLGGMAVPKSTRFLLALSSQVNRSQGDHQLLSRCDNARTHQAP